MPDEPAFLTAEQAAQQFAEGLTQYIAEFTARTGYAPQLHAELTPLIGEALRLARAPEQGWPIPVTWEMVRVKP